MNLEFSKTKQPNILGESELIYSALIQFSVREKFSPRHSPKSHSSSFCESSKYEVYIPNFIYIHTDILKIMTSEKVFSLNKKKKSSLFHIGVQGKHFCLPRGKFHPDIYTISL